MNEDNFTNKELRILLQLVAQASSQTAEGKIALGTLQSKLERLLSDLAPEQPQSGLE